MKINLELRSELSRILDEWDPIGINNPNENIFFNEYDMYIDEIVRCSYSKEAVYQYLINLYESLSDKPSEEGVLVTKNTAEKIVELLRRQWP